MIVNDSSDGESHNGFDNIYHENDGSGFAAQHTVGIGETGIFTAVFTDVYPGRAADEVRGLNHAKGVAYSQTDNAKQE